MATRFGSAPRSRETNGFPGWPSGHLTKPINTNYMNKGDFIVVKLSGQKDEFPYILPNMHLLEGVGLVVRKVGKSILAGEEGSVSYAWNPKWVEQITEKQFQELKLLKPIMNVVKRYMDNRDSSIQRLGNDVRDLGQAFIDKSARLNLELARLKKPDSEIISEKKTQIMDSILRLKKNSLVESVELSGERLVVETKKLNITCSDVEIPLKFTDLPKYRITIDFGNKMARVEKHSDKNFQSSKQHPHANNDGELCYGNVASHYASAMSSFDLDKIFKIVLGVLTSYNSAGPYISLEDFRNYSPECKKCHNRNVFQKCRSCGHENFKEKTLKPLK